MWLTGASRLDKAAQVRVKMKWLIAAFAVCVLAPGAHGATGTTAWCYHLPTCNDATWPTIVSQFCNGSRQSPINIVSDDAMEDGNLTAFTFTNYSSTSAMTTISNTGRTIKVALDSGVSVAGGGLPLPYTSLQFHLHWGNGTSQLGSEHTVNGKRYPMEMHIVSISSAHGTNVTSALLDGMGFAALGFFIEEMAGNATQQPASWNKLASLLSQITLKDQSVSIPPGTSLDDLLVGVNREQYYRYLGSLTTPTCNEAVVWTVFKDTIKVSKDVIDLFSTLHLGNTTSSPIMVNVYRNLQPPQAVTTQARASSATTISCSLGLMALSVILGKS